MARQEIIFRYGWGACPGELSFLRLLLGRLSAALEEDGKADAQLIEQHHGHRHHDLREDVRRGDDGRHYKDGHDGAAPDLAHDLRGQNAQPGLTKKEKVGIRFGLIFGVGFFALGAFFAYKVVLPFMLQFLIKQGQGTDYVASVSIANYISFLLLIFTIFGFIFEMPLVSVILSRLGILTPKIMRKIRGGAIVAIFVVAAIITPPDIFSQIMVGVPMVALYELSIGLCILFQKRRKAAEKAEEEEE